MSTAGNNTLFLDSSNPGIVGLAGGNDRYVLSSSSLSAGQVVTISDAEGANTLQLAGGLAIASSQVSNNAIQLTLTNGAIVNVLNASTFTFLTGGDAFTGTGGLTQTYAQFVTVALGSTVPAAGATPVAVGPVTLVDPSVPVVPVSNFALTTTATSVAEAASIEFTLTGDVSAIDQTFNLVISGDDKNGTAGITKADAADFPADVVKTVVLLAGETSVNFTITPVANDGVEGAQGFKVSVLDSSFSPVVSSDTVVITDAVVVVPGSLNLTVGEDSIIATAAGQTFTAPIVQNGLGAVTNTLESGDVIAGMGMGNTLKADIAVSTIGLLPLGPAISASTNNVQVVELRAQTINLDLLGGVHPNFSNVDAENFNGVEQWWSVNSRSNLQVEDVRTRPEDTTIGMRDTDPEVSFFVYFDPDQLDENIRTEDSALTLNVRDVANPGDLSGVPIDGLAFSLGGVSYTLRSADIGNATTYPEFLAALNAQLALQPDLATVSATLNPDNTITLLDSAGMPFMLGSWFFVNDSVPANGNIVFQQTVGDPSLVDVPISTNVLLDNVGRTSPGGELDIGSLGDGGVAEFNVMVDRSSWLERMESTSHLGNFVPAIQLDHLETVNFTSTGANGNVTVGERDNQLDGRVYDGLRDVRVVDGSAFKGTMNLGIEINFGSIERYLDGATAPVLFSYTGSAKADIFNIDVDSNTTDDPDFSMEVMLGAGDDRLILTGTNNLNTISVDGGTGNNTFVTDADIGVGLNPADIAKHEFKSFKNFQTFEIEGGSSAVDFTTLAGVTSVTVATNGNDDTDLIDLPVANVVISGKNQTLGNSSNNDQDFDDISILGTDTAVLTVTLQNTARIDGNLYVDDLIITAQNPGNPSAVRTLNLVSAGARQTTNEVGDINAPLVNTFNLSGTQDLEATITAASNSTGAAVARTNLVVNGSALTGDLDLTLAGALISAVDAGTTSTVSLTGTAGTADDLRLSGVINTTTDTTISGFETIHFGDQANGLDSSGVFDATNVSDVTLYEVNRINGNLTLDELKNTETVQINTDQGTVASQGELNFFAKNVSATSELNLNFRDFDAATNLDNNVNFAGDFITVQNFRTVNADLGGASSLDEAYFFTVDALDADGTSAATGVFADINWNTIATRALNVTGGGDRGAVGNAGGVDSVNLGLLANHLDTIDFSGYVGQTTFALFVVDPTLDVDNVTVGVQTFDRNTTIDVNGYSMNFTEFDQNAVNDSHITTFHFTTDAVATTENWTITGFDAFNDLGAIIDLSNLSVLDMRDLGVTGLVDLNIVDVGGFATITSNAGLNFEITLVGVTAVELTGDNFQFAA